MHLHICLSEYLYQKKNKKNPKGSGSRLQLPESDKEREEAVPRRDKQREKPESSGRSAAPAGSGAGKHAWLGRLDWAAAGDVHTLRSSLGET